MKMISARKGETGFFQSDYVMYTVESVSLKSKVERRYDEFIWVRDKLMKKMPYLIIPFLPQKKEKITQISMENRKTLLTV